jgi:uncharacterized MAPEG superfamily protein
MTIAYWCVLIAGVLPYLAALYAKAGGSGGFGSKENHDPRAFLATLEGARKRAVSAQLNAFEVTPLFAAAVIIAHLAGAAQQSNIDLLALLFVCSRVIFTLCYIYDLATLRSVVWAVGMGIIVSLFVVSA